MASDAYLRSQYEALLKENKLLKQNVDVLDRENYDLKRSVYELSLKVDAVQNALLKVTGRLGGKAATSVSSGNGSNVTHVPRIASDALEPFQVKNLLTSNPLATENSPSTLFLEEDSDAARKKQQIGKEEQDELGDDRVFFAKSELRAHTGAVYTAKFSPSGRILASGSLDCKIMLWDLTTKANQQQIASLTQHQQLVIDVSWSDDSSKLVSASYDHTVKLWDVEKAEQITSYNIEGLVQCVSMKSTDDGHFLCGTSKNTIHECDTRSDNITRAWKNDAMINTIYSSFCGQYFITGDSKGMIKTWDVRMDSCIEDLTRVNDSDNHAISHIHVSPSGLDSQGNDEDGRFLAVNSYDNILRVYDRRFKLISSSHGQDQLQLSYVLTGNINTPGS
ncbi:unnamed protein product [Albugo candida]|uniref:Uncharacterized protein n=1 Tax=Albugo candida TaxID=65357 RepID=A0A024G4X8_9STRA|nr:unnamed protein product [Albugo candida]|eukprot:CCI41816.1 unnamed protein product [Albugo candida]